MPWDPRVLEYEDVVDGFDAPVRPEGRVFVAPRVNDFGEIISRQSTRSHLTILKATLTTGILPKIIPIFRALKALTLSKTTCFMMEQPVMTLSTILSLLHMFATFTRQILRSKLLT
jgi:hypothetical protein